MGSCITCWPPACRGTNVHAAAFHNDHQHAACGAGLFAVALGPCVQAPCCCLTVWWRCVQGRSFHAAWTGQAAFRCYALLCIAALGCAGMLTEVQGLQALLRRRTKNVQGSGQREEGERLHAAVAWALLTAVHVQTSKLHAWIVSSPLPASPSAPSGPQRGQPVHACSCC